MEIIVAIIPTNLAANSILTLFCPFVETKSRINFSGCCWSGNRKYFRFFLIASRALIQRYAEFNRLL